MNQVSVHLLTKNIDFLQPKNKINSKLKVIHFQKVKRVIIGPNKVWPVSKSTSLKNSYKCTLRRKKRNSSSTIQTRAQTLQGKCSETTNNHQQLSQPMSKESQCLTGSTLLIIRKRLYSKCLCYQCSDSLNEVWEG